MDLYITVLLLQYLESFWELFLLASVSTVLLYCIGAFLIISLTALLATEE